MSTGHEIRHWKENFQGNSVWFKPEMRLKRTLKFGKKSFVEISLRISCTRWCKPERQPGKLWISLKIELQREGNFQKAMYCRKSKQFVCFFFFSEILRLTLKLLCWCTVFVFQTELFIACHFCFQLLRPSNTSNIFL